MNRVFDMNNPVWRFLGMLFDMAVLTVLWFICSLPVVTIGASTTALYYVALKLASNQEGYTVSDFFRSFRSNFRQSAVAWLILLGAGLLLSVDLFLYYNMKNSFATVMFFVFIILSFVYCMAAAYVFPLLARCETSVKNLFVMAFVMSVKNFGWTILMMTVSICIAALSVFVFAPLLIVSAGLAAYINSKILNGIYRCYNLSLAS